MNEQARQGRNFTLRIFASMLLISLFTIGYYQDIAGAFSTKKLLQQLIRLALTLVLMYYTLQGRKWAINLLIVLMVIGVFFALSSLLILPGFFPKIPILVLILIYGIGLNHFIRSANFKEFVRYKNMPQGIS